MTAALALAATGGFLAQFSGAKEGVEKIDELRKAQPTQEQIYETFYPSNP